jgi:hypothetical protein
MMGFGGSADNFLPLFIYALIKSNPSNLHLNMQYIALARNPSKLAHEAMYYFTHLMSSVSFILSLDHTCLSIEQDDYEKQVAKAKFEYFSALAAAAQSANGNDSSISGGGNRYNSITGVNSNNPNLSRVAKPSPNAKPEQSSSALHSSANELSFQFITDITSISSGLSNPVIVSQTSSSPSFPLKNSSSTSVEHASALWSSLGSLATNDNISTTSVTTSSAVAGSGSVHKNGDGKSMTNSDKEDNTTLLSVIQTSNSSIVNGFNSLDMNNLKFVSCVSSDVTVSDIPLLLKEYRMLISEVERLRSIVDAGKNKT